MPAPAKMLPAAGVAEAAAAADYVRRGARFSYEDAEAGESAARAAEIARVKAVIARTDSEIDDIYFRSRRKASSLTPPRGCGAWRWRPRGPPLLVPARAVDFAFMARAAACATVIARAGNEDEGSGVPPPLPAAAAQHAAPLDLASRRGLALRYPDPAPDSALTAPAQSALRARARLPHEPVGGAPVETYNGSFSVEERYHDDEGTLQLAGCVRYDGGFAHGRFEGHGRLSVLAPAAPPERGSTAALDDERASTEWAGRYVGAFARGLRHGHGYWWPARAAVRYCGQWRHDRPHGAGIAVVASGAEVRGHWRGGRPPRDAVVTLPCGAEYTGTLDRLWRAAGRGTLSLRRPGAGGGRGSVYSGDFRGGLPHGIGTLRHGSGLRISGFWRAGLPRGLCVVESPRAALYFGQLRWGRWCGRGRLSTPHVAVAGRWSGCGERGARFGPRWARRAACGRGVALGRNGDCYEGALLGALRHGRGVLRTAAGYVYSGRWRRGRWEGCEGELTLPGGHRTVRGRWRGREMLDCDTGVVLFKDEGLFVPHDLAPDTDDAASQSSNNKNKKSNNKSNNKSKSSNYKGKDQSNADPQAVAPASVAYHGYECDYDKAPSGAARAGPGSLHFANGDVFTGTFPAGLLEGQGECRYASGRLSSFRGQFERGQRHGSGAETAAAGGVLSATWVRGRREEGGAYARSPGPAPLRQALSCDDPADAELLRARRQGAAERGRRVQDKATGAWHDEGKGQVVLPGGEVYVGDFRDGRAHGAGTLSRDGAVVGKAEWRRGRLHGRGWVTAAVGDRARFSGDWRRGRPHGSGEFSSPRGATEVLPAGAVTYVGAVARGRPHGAGVLTLPFGPTYRGHFVRGAMAGQGAVTAPEGMDVTLMAPTLSSAAWHRAWDVFALMTFEAKGEMRPAGSYAGPAVSLWACGTGSSALKQRNGCINVYTGEWAGGLRHGRGRCGVTSPQTGCCTGYTGRFSAGGRQGPGIMDAETPTGTMVHRGEYVCDKSFGRGRRFVPWLGAAHFGPMWGEEVRTGREKYCHVLLPMPISKKFR